MCIPAPAITCVRTHHAQYQKKTNESFWYCAWCLRTHVIAGAGRHFPVLLPPSTLHTRQKVLKTEQIWTSIRGWTKSKILVRKTTRCLVFACFLTKRKTSLPYDKTSLPHILLIFTPHCSLPAAVPPKGGTGLVVRS